MFALNNTALSVTAGIENSLISPVEYDEMLMMPRTYVGGGVAITSTDFPFYITNILNSNESNDGFIIDNSVNKNYDFSDNTSVTIVLNNITRKVFNPNANSNFQNNVIVPLYAVIFLLSVIGNSLVILTLAQNKRMRTVTNVYLLNLVRLKNCINLNLSNLFIYFEEMILPKSYLFAHLYLWEDERT